MGKNTLPTPDSRTFFENYNKFMRAIVTKLGISNTEV